MCHGSNYRIYKKNIVYYLWLDKKGDKSLNLNFKIFQDTVVLKITQKHTGKKKLFMTIPISNT